MSLGDRVCSCRAECSCAIHSVDFSMVFLLRSNRLFPPAPIPAETSSMLPTPDDIIGVPFLRMSLGDSTGRKFFQVSIASCFVIIAFRMTFDQ